jgi:hypothetical protein
MTRESDLERWIEALSVMLRLDMPAQYRPGVRANLATALRMAERLERAKLRDDAEPAAVYRP